MYYHNNITLNILGIVIAKSSQKHFVLKINHSITLLCNFYVFVAADARTDYNLQKISCEMI